MFKKVLTFFAAAVMVTAMTVPSMAATRLDTPENLYWDGDDGIETQTEATWDEVDYAKSYELSLYRISDSGSYIKVGETKTKKTKHDFSWKMTEEGDYVFKVRALINSSSYSNSSWSDYSDPVYVPEAFTQWVKDGRKKQDPKTSGPGINQGGQDTTTGQADAQVGAGTGQAGWRQDEKGCWYATNADGSEWFANGWQWIDGNQDGTAECYCFDGNGYLYADTTTPDGYTVNADGAWTVDGVVQVQSVN